MGGRSKVVKPPFLAAPANLHKMEFSLPPSSCPEEEKFHLNRTGRVRVQLPALTGKQPRIALNVVGPHCTRGENSETSTHNWRTKEEGNFTGS